jgi:hypothetical protein
MIKNITIKMELKIKEQIINDLLITALEGGSNYWYLIDPKWKCIKKGDELATDVILREVMYEGKSINIHDIEDENTILGILNKEKIIKGTELLFNQEPEYISSIENEDYDAGIADIWFQYVIMGEIIFG